MNKSDAERICSVLDSMGYERTEDETDAEIIGVVACSVRQSAINRVYSRIHNWNKWKKERHLLTFVSGCMLPADRKKFSKLFDVMFEMKDLPRVPELFQMGGITLPSTFWKVQPSYSSKFEAFVPIQNGCDKFCTYCAVPYTRGREESRPSNEILDEVQGLIDQGYKRITLLGQNVNSYGLDKETELNFSGLMKKIGEMGGDVWINYTSPHPRDMTVELLEVQAAYPTLVNLVHLPLQSGNDDVLKRMNRKYSYEQYKVWAKRVREYLPDVVLTTDAIVGFPGETEEQFQDTIKAFEEMAYDLAFTAQYSPRPGALAEKHFPDDIPKEEKKRREKLLIETLRVTALAQNEKLIGSSVRVLVEKMGKYGWLGRTAGMKPVVFQSTEENLTGSFVTVMIKEVTPWRLEGEMETSSEKKATILEKTVVSTVERAP